MTPALELRQVSKVYGSGPSEVHALNQVDLSVERDELVAVMGPSGSGKSTLLTIAGSLEEATSGQVLVDGTDLATVSRSDRAKMRRRSIGYVFQDFNLLPGLKAIENVTLPLELDGVRGEAARATRRSRRWRSSTSQTLPITTPTSCRAASASGLRSPERSSASADCFSPTSRPALSTPSTARRSCACCGPQRSGVSPASS